MKDFPIKVGQTWRLTDDFLIIYKIEKLGINKLKIHAISMEHGNFIFELTKRPKDYNIYYQAGRYACSISHSLSMMKQIFERIS